MHPLWTHGYGSPEGPQQQQIFQIKKTKISRHKRNSYDTKENLTTQKKFSQHKRKSHDTKEILTTQKKFSRHKRKSHNTKENLTTQKKISQKQKIEKRKKEGWLLECTPPWGGKMRGSSLR